MIMKLYKCKRFELVKLGTVLEDLTEIEPKVIKEHYNLMLLRLEAKRMKLSNYDYEIHEIGPEKIQDLVIETVCKIHDLVIPKTTTL